MADVLIAELQKRRMTAAEVAKFLGVSKVMAYQRIKALETLPVRGLQVEFKRVGKSGPLSQAWFIEEG